MTIDKYYTIGEVLDNMKFGEVAVNVVTNDKLEVTYMNYKYKSILNGVAIYFDELEGGRLKMIGSNNNITYFKNDDEEKYVIMTREVYENINNLKLKEEM